jgi:hypothetical protein
MENPGMPVSSPSQAMTEALERLATELDPRDHDSRLVTEEGPVPFLAIRSCHAQLGEEVYADGQFYRWSWGQPIAAVGNPKAAASKIRHVLAATPEASHA